MFGDLFVRLSVIDERAFLFLVHETPMFAIQVMRSTAERIRELGASGWATPQLGSTASERILAPACARTATLAEPSRSVRRWGDVPVSGG
jgi:hypothetical protein